MFLESEVADIEEGNPFQLPTKYPVCVLLVYYCVACLKRQAPVPRPHISAVLAAIRGSLAKDSETAMGHSWSRGTIIATNKVPISYQYPRWL